MKSGRKYGIIWGKMEKFGKNSGNLSAAQE